MTTNRELKNLLEIEENKERYAAIRNLNRLERELKDIEPYTAAQASFNSVKLQMEKRAMPDLEYGMSEGLSLLWAWRWGLIVLISLFFIY
tara:strand:+ start:266 stop:535 length:270 start_codon:yes stop_codon:yes gene_type:complete